MVAVDDLDAAEPDVGQVLDRAGQLREVLLLELYGMGEHRDAAGFADQLDRSARREHLLVEIRAAALPEVLFERLANGRDVSLVDEHLRDVRPTDYAAAGDRPHLFGRDRDA